MKLILAQPSVPRFQWELEVLLTNISSWFDLNNVILLFSKHDPTVPRYLVNKFPGVQCFIYEDKRTEHIYISSIRSYLWWQFLSKDPAREQETYFYIDSDTIFREPLDFSKIGFDENTWVGSECPGYIDYKYIAGCKNGPALAEYMAHICGITLDQLKAVPPAGAQMIMVKPTAAYWERNYRDTTEMYRYLANSGSDIQFWTTDMWTTIYGAIREGKTIKVSPEMAFCTATDDIDKWDKTKIMHNAGVTGAGGDLFFKGQYTATVPFGEDFSYVNKQKCSVKYVEAIQKVVR